MTTSFPFDLVLCRACGSPASPCHGGTRWPGARTGRARRGHASGRSLRLCTNPVPSLPLTSGGEAPVPRHARSLRQRVREHLAKIRAERETSKLPERGTHTVKRKGPVTSSTAGVLLKDLREERDGRAAHPAAREGGRTRHASAMRSSANSARRFSTFTRTRQASTRFSARWSSCGRAFRGPWRTSVRLRWSTRPGSSTTVRRTLRIARLPSMLMDAWSAASAVASMDAWTSGPVIRRRPIRDADE